MLLLRAGQRPRLIRDQGIQVLHGFDPAAHANNYLTSELFTTDVARELGPLLQAVPDIRMFDVV